MATVIDTPEGIQRYRAMCTRSGLRACKVGLRVNRAYTPTACLKAAGQITNQKFKRGEYDKAIKALDHFIETGVPCHG
jgi:hypothetical protein